MSHTPVPWKTNGYEGKLAAAVHSIDGKVLVCAVQQPLLPSLQPDDQTAHDNAEFIVRACNLHYGLLEALKKTMRTMRLHHGSDCKCSECQFARAVIDKATS